MYSRQPEKAGEAFEDTVQYFASAELNPAGAYSVELALTFFTTLSQCIVSDSPSSGGYHKSGSDSAERLTGTVKDKDGNRMYFRKPDDNAYWDRIHIPGSATTPSSQRAR